MDRIILEVDDRSAKKWMYASQDRKKQLSKSIGQLIDKSLSRTMMIFGNSLIE